MSRLVNNDITPEDLFLDKDVQAAMYVSGLDNSRYLIGLGVLIGIGILFFIGRIFQLQLNATENSIITRDTVISQNYIKPLRGNIYDRRGVLLAYNQVVFSLVLNKELLPTDSEQKNRSFAEIASFFKIEEENIQKAMEAEEKQIVLQDNISQEEAITFQVKEDEYPGFELKQNNIRQYVDSSYFSHLIGYTGKLSDADIIANPRYTRDDIIGKTGLERVYESTLKGEYGLKNTRDSERPLKRPQNGKSIQLTIDAELQKVLHDSMQEVLNARQLQKAAGIVMNPQNGEVLAMVSLPTFDNNLFTQGISQENYNALINDKNNPLLNRCIGGEYAPASTIKPLIASGLLQESIITADTTINDPLGKLIVENPYDKDRPFVYPDWKIHGISNTYKSISDSVNVFYYTFVGGTPTQRGLGIQKLAEYYRYYGFGNTTGIDLGGEVKGNIANPEWKERVKQEPWLLGDTYNASIGQGGMLATPLQILNATNAIANRGNLYKPYLYQGVRTDDGSLIEQKNPEIIQKIPVSQENYTIVKEGMRQTISDGTGYQLQSLPFSTAGKTGTAQTGKENNNSWFVSYGPFENPQLSVIVLIEEGNDSFETTIPITKKVYEWYYQNRGFKE